MWFRHPRIGGLLSARNIVVGGAVLFALWCLLLPSNKAQAALTAFIAGAAIWLYLISRDQLASVKVKRTHQPRVFEDDPVALTLRVTRGAGLPIQMIEVEDRFFAALSTLQCHLVPVLTEGWEILIHDRQIAERHRGLYLIGPTRLRAADPLGVFFDQIDTDCVTSLTIYPRNRPLPDYTVPGPLAPAGSSMDEVDRIGQGDEILGVREYRPGDPPTRIHWRTSARRGRLHVVQLNRPIQAELAVMVDLTRHARFGVGGDTTIELAIASAVSILTRGYEARHRLSLSYTGCEATHFPTGSGLAHLHLLLDRLAIVEADGESDFWEACAPRASMLAPGSRAVLIVPAVHAPLKETRILIERLGASGVSVDLVLIDHRDFIKIYRDQEEDQRLGWPTFAERIETFGHAGARVWPLHRKEGIEGLAESEMTNYKFNST